MHRLTSAGVVAALLGGLLTGCSSGEDPAAAEGRQQLRAPGGVFTIDVPQEWEQQDTDPDQGNQVLRVADPDGVASLTAYTFGAKERATDKAIDLSARFSRDGDLCFGRGNDQTFGEPRLVYECKSQRDGRAVRLLLFPIENPDEKQSVLLDIVYPGTTLEATSAGVTPVLESFTFR